MDTYNEELASSSVQHELDIARGFVEVYGDRLRYAHGLGWLVSVG